MWAKSSTRYVRAPSLRGQSGQRCGPDADPGPPWAASRRGCRPCALAAGGPCCPAVARRPPSPSFYRDVSRAAGGAARRGARARTRAALQPPSAPPSPPIVSGGRRALPAALGPGSGAACVRRGFRAGRSRAPSPAAGSRREPGGARAGPRLSPGLACRSGSDSSRRSILSPWPRTVASWKAAFTALCIPRAGFPGRCCSRLRRLSACRLSPPPLALAGGGSRAARLQQVLRLLDPHRSSESRCARS